MTKNNLATLAKITKLIVSENLNYRQFSTNYILLQQIDM